MPPHNPCTYHYKPQDCFHRTHQRLLVFDGIALLWWRLGIEVWVCHSVGLRYVWDVETHALCKRALGCMVEIEGLTCSNRQPGNEDWARAPGDERRL